MKLILLILLFANILFANIGKIVSIKGEANITRENKVFQVKKDTLLKKRDILSTKNNSKVQILFKDETIISIGKNSIFKIDDYLFENKNNVKAEFSMIKGVFRTITGKIGKIAPQNFTLKTKSASIGIRGTQIITQIVDGREKIFCTEGQIEVTQTLTNLKIIVNKGEFIDMEKNIGSTLQKNKTKSKDLKEINKNVSLNQNKAVDSASKENSIDLNSNLDSQTSINETSITEKVENVTNEAEEQEAGNLVEEQAQELDKEKEEEKDIEEIDTEKELTPLSYFQNNSSKATYKGDFNTESFNVNNQYLMNKDTNIKSQIPTNTLISMDIDFGKVEDNITNGEISSLSYDEIFEFKGESEIENGKLEIDLVGINGTSGEGRADLFDSEANTMKGDLHFVKNNLEIEGIFEATKYEYINDLNILTEDRYFIDNESTASYKGSVESNFILNSKISMDINFSETSNQITKGKINITFIGIPTSKFTFKGSINDDNHANFVGTDGTTGTGDADFYGKEADIMKGTVDFKNGTNEISNNFQASKK